MFTVKTLSDPWVPVFEGEDPTDPPPADPPPSDGIKFTDEQQAHVNRILAEEKKKHTSRTQAAITEVEALRSKSKLTAQEREELDGRISTLQAEMMTKEELSKKHEEKLKKKYDEDLGTATSERDAWQKKYTRERIKRSITGAAIAEKAFDARQIQAIIGPQTRLVEVLDEDGKPTDELREMVKFQDTDKEGKPVELDLSVADAVKRMAEMEEYFNLFQGEGTGGTGKIHRTTGSNKKADAAVLAKDNPEEYRRLRRSGELKLG